MMKASVFVLVLAVLCVSASAQTSWQYCDPSNPGPVITVSSVTLNPDPPVIGTNDTVTLLGTSTQDITGGTVSLTIFITFGSLQFPVYNQNYNICDFNPCPQAAGSVSAGIVIDGNSLPAGAPSGTYIGHATVSDNSGNQLVCVDVTFQL